MTAAPNNRSSTFSLFSSSNAGAEVRDPKIGPYQAERSALGTLMENRNLSRSNWNNLPDSGKVHQVSLNDVPLAKAAQLILHDKLGYPVQIDTGIKGTISLEAGNGISTNNLLRLFGTALRDSGANLTISGGVAIIKSGSVFPMPRHENGAGISILQLNHISSDDFIDLVSSMIGNSLQARSDRASNSLIVSGPSISVEGLLDLARQMDKPEWRFASYALIPVDPDSGSATAGLVSEVFAGSTAPSITLKYIENLSSLWVIGVSDLAIERAKQVIIQFEKFAFQSKPQRIVWPLKSAKAGEITKLLQSLMSSDDKTGVQSTALSSTSAGRGAGKNSAEEAPPPKGQPGATGSGGNKSGSSGSGGSGQGILSELGGLGLGGDGTGFSGAAGETIIIADANTNSIVFEITPHKWKRILPVLLELDRPVKQVYISVNILEVTLTDALSFGLQHALSFGDFDWVLSATTSPSLVPTLPGLAISIDSAKIDIFLDQLAQATDLTIVSTPNLMVQHGTKGEIRVGDQVPTLLSQTSTNDGDFTKTQIDYRSTGLTLDVTPFVDGRDQVTIAVSASVDSASTNDTSGIDSPVISQRSINTTITSRHNQTIILGGLRRQTKEDSKSRLPFLKRWPGLNRLMGSTSKSITETELIILLTPRVVSGMADLGKLSSKEIARIAATYEHLGSLR